MQLKREPNLIKIHELMFTELQLQEDEAVSLQPDPHYKQLCAKNVSKRIVDHVILQGKGTLRYEQDQEILHLSVEEATQQTIAVVIYVIPIEVPDEQIKTQLAEYVEESKTPWVK